MSGGSRPPFEFYPELPLFSQPDDSLGQTDGISRNDDTFSFLSHASELAERLTAVEGYFTLGVFGAWGSGKTSFCNLLRLKLEALELKSKRTALAISYNAWQYENEPEPLSPLMGRIAGKLEEKGTGSKICEALKGSFIGLMYGVKGEVKIGLPKVIEVKASVAADKALDKVEAVVKTLADQFENHQMMAPLMEKLVTQLNKDDAPRFYIFIDDLDRCTPKMAVKLLEKIKLLLNLPKCVFILALNQDIIDDFLKKQYHDDFGITNFSVERFTGKLIQMSFFLPRAKFHMTGMIKKVLVETGLWAQSVPREDLISLIALGSAYNPRAAIRLINKLLHRINCGAALKSGERFLQLTVYESLCQLAPRLVQELERQVVTRDYVLYCLEEKEAQTLHGFLKDFGVHKNHVGPLLELLRHDMGRAWLLSPSEPLDPPSYQKTTSGDDLVPFPIRPQELIKPERRWQLFELVEYYLKRSTPEGRVVRLLSKDHDDDEASEKPGAAMELDFDFDDLVSDSQEGSDEEITVIHGAEEVDAYYQGQKDRRDKVMDIIETLRYLPQTSEVVTFCEQVVRRIIEAYTRETGDSWHRVLQDLPGEMAAGFEDRCAFCLRLCDDYYKFHAEPDVRIRFSFLGWTFGLLRFTSENKKQARQHVETHVERMYRFLASGNQSNELISYLTSLTAWDGVPNDKKMASLRKVLIKLYILYPVQREYLEISSD